MFLLSYTFSFGFARFVEYNVWASFTIYMLKLQSFVKRVRQLSGNSKLSGCVDTR